MEAPETQNRERGRRVLPFPTLTLPDSGYTIEVRRIAADAIMQLQLAARRELEPEKPPVPICQTELGPEENPADAAYQDALAAWGDQVSALAGHKFMALVANYAVVTPTDAGAVADLRAAMMAIACEVADDDRTVFVWSIVAPTETDRKTLMAFVVGKSLPTESAVRAQRESFPGDVAGP